MQRSTREIEEKTEAPFDEELTRPILQNVRPARDVRVSSKTVAQFAPLVLDRRHQAIGTGKRSALDGSRPVGDHRLREAAVELEQPGLQSIAETGKSEASIAKFGQTRSGSGV